MSSGRRRRVREIFIQVVDVAKEKQVVLLEQFCGEDRDLRREVEDLLRAEHEAVADGFLSEPAAVVIEPSDEERIGVYKLLEQIGEGGFGVVFVAEQEQPVRRRVALKLIKLGMDTRDVVARFEQERQALAMMDHPNIAKVLDAGATPAGRPYFVMEYVKGKPITKFADAHRLDVRERLALFAQVCAAVQHAHTKGVIHRDLKPENVLVAMTDGLPFAKIIDFGIAKAIGARLTNKTIFTEHRQLIGTPQYMSPEQAEGLPDIDASTDVYSLGVLLYELLVGTTPFGNRALRDAGVVEVIRHIRDVDPPRPSAMLAKLPATVDPQLEEGELPPGVDPSSRRVAQMRKCDARQLAATVRGELDVIVMKAIEKVRGQRYQTANALAQDVLRYLEGQPISAVAPSAWYTASKVLRRHRTVVALTGASCAVLLIVAVVAAMGWQGAWELRRVLHGTEGELDGTREAHAKTKVERDDLLERADDFEHELVMVKRHSEFAEYRESIQLAQSALERGDLRSLGRNLERSPESLRGWEWRYLEAMRDGSLRSFGGHRGSVTAVAFGPGREAIVTACADGVARRFEVEGEREPRSFSLAGGEGLVAVAYDGKFVITATANGKVRKWDAQTRAQVGTPFSIPEVVITAAASAPGATAIALGDADGRIHLIELTLAEGGGSEPLQPRTIGTHEGAVTSVAYSGDGSRLITAGADGMVRAWDVAGGTLIASCRHPLDGVVSVVLFPNGERVGRLHADGTVRLSTLPHLDAVDEVTRPYDVGGPARILSVSPDGRLLAVAAAKSIHLFDATNLRRGPRATFKGHHDAVVSLAFSADSSRLASAGTDRLARLWDTRDLEHRVRFEGGVVRSTRAIAPDGRRVALIYGGRVEVRDLGTGELLASLVRPGMPPNAAFFTPDGDRVVVHAAASAQNWTGDGAIFDAWTGEVVAVLRELGSMPAPSPDEPLFNSAGYHHSGLSFSPTGDLIAVPTRGWKAELYDWRTGARLCSLGGHGGEVSQTVFSPDGRQVLTLSDDGSARLWSTAVAAGKADLVVTLRGRHDGPVEDARFSAQGAAIATRGRDRQLAVWRAVDAERLQWECSSVLRFEEPVEVLSLSEDGERLGVLRDNAVEILVTATGSTIREFELPDGARCLMLYGDFDRLMCAAPDGGVQVWSVSNQKLLFQSPSGGAAEFACFALGGEALVAVNGHSLLHSWDARKAAERSRAIDRMMRDKELLRPRLVDRIERGELLRDLRAEVVRDSHLTDEQRWAALSILAEEQVAEPQDVPGDAVAEVLDRELQDARRTFEDDPTDPHRLTTLGILLYRDGQYELAIETLRRCEGLRSGSSTGEVDASFACSGNGAYIAMAQWQLGRIDEARASLELTQPPRTVPA